jgi:pyruvate/2-oxoglutarate dehydrogenase complex dihydrolipoamide acyltransferase (E2) component
MSKIERKPALAKDHPIASLAQPQADPEPQSVPQTQEPAAPAATPAAATPAPQAAAAPSPEPAAAAASAEPYAGSTQFNVRASSTMRDHLRVAAAGMTLATGEKWSQDRLVRHAVAAYLAHIADEYNGGRPFHER